MSGCWYIEGHAPPFQNPNSMIPVQDHEFLQIDPEPIWIQCLGKNQECFTKYK